MQLLLIIYALIVAALTLVELREARNLQRILKPLAALGFCLIALWVGHTHHLFDLLYWKIIFAALVACAIGDVCLLSRDNPTLFKAGMAAFALGHILYVWAIVTAGTHVNIFVMIALLAVGAGIYKYLYENLTSDMRLPVMIYTLIIMTMVITAVGSSKSILIAAAVMFAVSDIFVARDRFVAPNPKNALAISPLYFGAQALFAISPALINAPSL